MLAAFRRSYDSEGWRRTLLQGSAKEMLAELVAAGAALWIVTNKPALSSGMILEELGVEYKRQIWLDDGGRHSVAEYAYGDTQATVTPPADLFGGSALPPGTNLNIHILETE